MPPIQLLITRHPNGQVEVQGPVDDELLCSGILAIAMRAVGDHARAKKEKQANGQGIIPASADMLNRLPSGN